MAMDLFIKRNILAELKNDLKNKELSLIIGPRQAGKTTIMQILQNELNQKGNKTLFLSLDFEMDRHFFDSQSSLLKKIELEIGKGKGYVFIDEIQRKENAGLFLKGIYDLNLPYKFIVSGSGTLELKEKIHESLTGRKRVFEVSTISFDEFVNFKTHYRYEDKLKDFFETEVERRLHLLDEYLNFGGYPRVVIEEKLIEKRKIIDEILHSYLEKDIAYLLRIEKLDAFSSLIRILASQIGSIINYSEIARTIGISMSTVKNYFWYAEKTFIIQRLTPYFKNIRKEITKSPVVYFYDLGLRNYSTGLFGGLLPPGETGFLFQNFVFNILKEKMRFSGAVLHFWRTKDGAEVDFIIDTGRKTVPVEVKFKGFNKPVVERGIKSFIEKYKPQNFFIVNKNLETELQVDGTNVIFLPFWKLLIKDLNIN